MESELDFSSPAKAEGHFADVVVLVLPELDLF
jgi:hypothetical protein